MYVWFNPLRKQFYFQPCRKQQRAVRTRCIAATPPAETGVRHLLKNEKAIQIRSCGGTAGLLHYSPCFFFSFFFLVVRGSPPTLTRIIHTKPTNQAFMDPKADKTHVTNKILGPAAAVLRPRDEPRFKTNHIILKGGRGDPPRHPLHPAGPGGNILTKRQNFHHVWTDQTIPEGELPCTPAASLRATYHHRLYISRHLMATGYLATACTHRPAALESHRFFTTSQQCLESSHNSGNATAPAASCCGWRPHRRQPTISFPYYLGGEGIILLRFLHQPQVKRRRVRDSRSRDAKLLDWKIISGQQSCCEFYHTYEGPNTYTVVPYLYWLAQLQAHIFEGLVLDGSMAACCGIPTVPGSVRPLHQLNYVQYIRGGTNSTFLALCFKRLCHPLALLSGTPPSFWRPKQKSNPTQSTPKSTLHCSQPRQLLATRRGAPGTQFPNTNERRKLQRTPPARYRTETNPDS